MPPVDPEKLKKMYDGSPWMADSAEGEKTKKAVDEEAKKKASSVLTQPDSAADKLGAKKKKDN